MASKSRTLLNLMRLEVRTVPTAAPWGTDIPMGGNQGEILISDNESVAVKFDHEVVGSTKPAQRYFKPNPTMEVKPAAESKPAASLGGQSLNRDAYCFPITPVAQKKPSGKDIKPAEAPSILTGNDGYLRLEANLAAGGTSAS